MKYDGITYKIRFFKFILPSGELEILATNLSYGEASDENPMNMPKILKIKDF